MGKKKTKKRPKGELPKAQPGEVITTVFARGKWWTKISPKWVKGYRPAVTYREAHGRP
jgi:hypothetical protein